MVEDEKVEHQAESIDEFELKNQVLSEDERKVLHDIMITYEKEKLGTQHLEAGKGSAVGHYDISSETLTNSA